MGYAYKYYAIWLFHFVVFELFVCVYIWFFSLRYFVRAHVSMWFSNLYLHNMWSKTKYDNNNNMTTHMKESRKVERKVEKEKPKCAEMKTKKKKRMNKITKRDRGKSVKNNIHKWEQRVAYDFIIPPWKIMMRAEWNRGTALF